MFSVWTKETEARRRYLSDKPTTKSFLHSLGINSLIIPHQFIMLNDLVNPMPQTHLRALSPLTECLTHIWSGVTSVGPPHTKPEHFLQI